MNKISAETILNVVKGRLHCGSLESVANSVFTDTREKSDGAAFFALVGENFDANDFLQNAVDQGASVIICERADDNFQPSDVAVIVVEDGLTALQRFAAWYQEQLELHVIGITGSNGKTSTKDFTRAVLSAAFNVNATLGNFNNHIGLPLTVLSADDDTEAAVWEMGMNHPGEIAPLCQIAQPKIGIITNIGTAHIEYMGSRDAIADEKGALARALPQDGVLIVPASCDYVEYFRDHTKAKLMVVGNGRGVVRAEKLKMNTNGSEFDLVIEGQEPVAVSLPVVGKHMITNALLAAAAGYVLGMKPEVIAEALSTAELTSGRLRSFVTEDIRIIDDTYNANPESVRAAIDTLADIDVEGSGKRYVVLGKMAELGEHAAAAYEGLGQHTASQDLHLVSVGEEAKAMYQAACTADGEAVHFNEVSDAAEWLKSNAKAGDVVLFKGSRAASMERVMQQAFID